ncbi:MAG: helix-turn-helix transcriptional regulator [Erysipelotrichaceae bacterium]|nr:helix-turn-helix transcriptional regulator [Erysipelotrichaceae bacterium]
MSKQYIAFALGKRIAYLRKQKGWTQLQFSLETGIAKSYVCELESGKRNPHLLVLEKVCDGLGITFSELFEGL